MLKIYLYPILAFLISLPIGFIVKLIFKNRLSYFNQKFNLGLPPKTINSFSNICFFWVILLGIHISISIAEVPVKFQHIIETTNKLLIILFIITLAWISSKIIVTILNFYIQQKTDLPPKVSILEIVIKVLILFVGFILILDTLKINITPFITSLGIAGLAVGLALQDTLSNFFAGLHILMTKQIKPGDYISLEGGFEGFVEDITWRNTVIRTLPNNLIIVPNSKIASSIVTNYFLPDKELAILVQVGVSYDSDLEKVERVTIEVANEVMKEVPGGVPDFEPFIRYHTFGDFSINFTVVLRVKSYTDRYAVIHEFIKRLHKRYKEEGIKIPFPIRTIYLKQ
ncbi:MAG: mechanosensitive ion channel protein MscS [Thermodesulfobacterium geofontis]|uniref:Mechanosensitive ion channel protein MscS n=1 Tax=Thermodesulfobacterium geofontis TaxID=1295609 RepID=A0A2N7PMV6_9BACT|nr:MAG: mechanosensitive ion channel protein MscS [Thermodesulfobacterium geofontis]